MILNINGYLENVIDEEDFKYHIAKYMGIESADYYSEILDNYMSAIKNLEEELRDALDVQEELESKIAELKYELEGKD